MHFFYGGGVVSSRIVIL